MLRQDKVYFSLSGSTCMCEQIFTNKNVKTDSRFLYNHHTSSYNYLLTKLDRCMMLISCQRALCIDICKTTNKLNPPFMQKIFKLCTSCYSLRNPNDLVHITPNQTTFSSKSLRYIGPQIWNNLPNELKSAEN